MAGFSISEKLALTVSEAEFCTLGAGSSYHLLSKFQAVKDVTFHPEVCGENSMNGVSLLLELGAMNWRLCLQGCLEEQKLFTAELLVSIPSLSLMFFAMLTSRETFLQNLLPKHLYKELSWLQPRHCPFCFRARCLVYNPKFTFTQSCKRFVAPPAGSNMLEWVKVLVHLGRAQYAEETHPALRNDMIILYICERGTWQFEKSPVWSAWTHTPSQQEGSIYLLTQSWDCFSNGYSWYHPVQF